MPRKRTTTKATEPKEKQSASPHICPRCGEQVVAENERNVCSGCGTKFNPKKQK